MNPENSIVTTETNHPSAPETPQLEVGHSQEFGGHSIKVLTVSYSAALDKWLVKMPLDGHDDYNHRLEHFTLEVGHGINNKISGGNSDNTRSINPGDMIFIDTPQNRTILQFVIESDEPKLVLTVAQTE